MADLFKLKGRYELKESLGQGGMGVVYRAYDAVLKCDVAVKMIRDTPDPTALQLFQRESEVLTALNHPNIVQILDLGEFSQDGQMRPFFVMPLLPGSTLDQMIKGGQLTIQRSVDMLAQICRGLSAAHERGLIHRDLKPGNIIVMPDDSVEIIDFGVAHMTNTGATVGQKGTLLFMAPELLENKPPSPLSDIFALGVIAYQMFSRRRPFERASEREVIEAILHETPPPVSDIDHNVNQAISRVIHKAMAKQPWHRFSTAREFGELIQKAFRGEPIDYFDPARTRPRMERAKKALEQGDLQFASEILTELNAEGHLDPQMSLVRRQIDVAVRQKRVQQLLESARPRLEDDEYPLAMQKVQEALSLEPDNAEALGLKAEIESSSSERQMEGWFRLVRQHIDNSAYGHAREALRNVIQVRPEDTRAKDLLAEVDRLEQEHVRARKEKDTLYHAAVEEFQKGEVSSALGKLEKVLEIDRKTPDRSSTDRGAIYQNFYNEVRLEHDSMASLYAEARKHLEDQNFGKALAICDQFLAKFPGHALFQALKFDIEERQRQRLSSFVAEVDRRVEAEPDLERKENILEEALLQFPEEPHFESSLKLIRSRLSLVNSIISKARYHEERGQFTEALGQWEILKTIHGKYPGLDFEMERLITRRDQQARQEAKARWVEKIDGHLQVSELDQAAEAVRRSLTEFPEDPELLALQKLASQAQERKSEAQRVLAESKDIFARADFEAGIAALKRAHELDQRDPGIRAALTSKLTERARQLLEQDWHAAEELVSEALELDPGYTPAKSVRVLIEDRRREEFVDRTVAQIRELQTAGDLIGALAQVERCLSVSPSEPRLKRLKEMLSGSITDTQSALARANDLERMQQIAARAQSVSAPAQIDELVALMSKIAAKYPHEPEFKKLLQGIEQRSPGQETRTALLLAPQETEAVHPNPVVLPNNHAIEPDATAIFVMPQLAPRIDSPAKPPDSQPPLVSPQPPATPHVNGGQQHPPSRTQANVAPPLPNWLKLGMAAVVLLGVGAGAWFLRPKATTTTVVTNPTEVPATVDFEIHANPPGASILLGARTLGKSETQFSLPPGQHQLTAMKDGYQPATLTVDLKPGSSPGFNVNLKPLPSSFRLFTPFKSGNVTWDSKAPETLGADGQLALTALDPGRHTLQIESGSAKASVSFDNQPLTLPVLLRPATKGIDAIAVASYQDQAVLESSLADAPVLVDNQPAGKLAAGELTLKSLSAGPHALAVGAWTGSFESGPAPFLTLVLGSFATQGKLIVEVHGFDDSHVFVNGVDRGVAKKGKYQQALDPGDYEILVSGPGFLAVKPQKIKISNGVSSKLSFLLIPQPAVAAPVPSVILPPPKLQGSVNVTVMPANAEVRFVRSGESNTQVFRMPSMQLDAGFYVFTAHAAGFADSRRMVEVTAGGAQNLNLILSAAKAAAPVRVAHTMKLEDWDKPWTADGGWYSRQGGEFVLYKLTPSAGVFHFAITAKESHGFLGIGGMPKMRVVLNYVDSKNYSEFQIDKQSYSAEEYRNGKRIEHTKKKPHEIEASSFQFRVTVEPTKMLIEVLSGQNYATLDQWSEPDNDLTQGRFGFHLPNQDQIFLTNFSFEQQTGVQ